MTGLFQDVRLAARWLVRRPGLAATSIVSLALGIGASTAAFSRIDALLYRSSIAPFPSRRAMSSSPSSTRRMASGQASRRHRRRLCAPGEKSEPDRPG